jgi:methionine synthase II (cobalamin-independent)
MPVTNTTWSDTEQKIAQEAFHQAYDREIRDLMEEVKSRSASIQQIDDLWQIHDLLSARRHQIDGKYDARPSALMFVLAQLLKEKLISIDELKGLEPGKLAKIAALSKM